MPAPHRTSTQIHTNTRMHRRKVTQRDSGGSSHYHLRAGNTQSGGSSHYHLRVHILQPCYIAYRYNCGHCVTCCTRSSSPRSNILASISAARAIVSRRDFMPSFRGPMQSNVARLRTHNWKGTHQLSQVDQGQFLVICGTDDLFWTPSQQSVRVRLHVNWDAHTNTNTHAHTHTNLYTYPCIHKHTPMHKHTEK